MVSLQVDFVIINVTRNVSQELRLLRMNWPQESASTTELRRQLHWLLASQRNDCTVGTRDKIYRHSCVPGLSAGESQTTSALQSSNKNLLTVPQLSLALSVKVLCVSACAAWNLLSDSCREAELVSITLDEHGRLKSELFYIACEEQL